MILKYQLFFKTKTYVPSNSAGYELKTNAPLWFLPAAGRCNGKPNLDNNIFCKLYREKRNQTKHKKEFKLFSNNDRRGLDRCIYSKKHKEAIVDALRYCIQEKGLNVYAFCIMTNHLHLIVNCQEQFELKDVIRDFKKFTSKKIIKQIIEQPESRREWMLDFFKKKAEASSKNKTYKFWQTGNHAIELINEKFTWEKINYIHNNPVEEKFVNQSFDWKYSSATNYAELDSVLNEVHCLTLKQQTLR